MYRWQNWSDKELLELRFCDLRIDWQNTRLKLFTEKLKKELESKGLHMRPGFWLSREFFVADGSTGIALPFYLAHPRLKRLELAQMGEVEGGSDRDLSLIHI